VVAARANFLTCTLFEQNPSFALICTLFRGLALRRLLYWKPPFFELEESMETRINKKQRLEGRWSCLPEEVRVFISDQNVLHAYSSLQS
jgi:hypothetical protein